MKSEFQKLIRQVFGAKLYMKYSVFVRNNFRRKSMESRNVYNDIYRLLKPAREQTLVDMMQHVEDVMVDVLRICRTYFIAVLVYAASMGLLMWLGAESPVKYYGMGLLTLVFLYKTCEFVVNKYCFIDARIVLTYKSVLEKLIEEAATEPKIELLEGEDELPEDDFTRFDE